MKLDEYTVYADTDSLKLLPGYDKKVLEDYNNFVENKIKYVSKVLEIDIDKFSPSDTFGNKHTLGVFEHEGHEEFTTYEEFITQGAKKYAYTQYKKNDKINKENDNIIKEGKEKSLVLNITVSGVPKCRFICN